MSEDINTAASQAEQAEPVQAEPLQAEPDKKTQNPNSILRLTVTLGAICAVCALLLSLVNLITADRIAENKLGEKKIAMEAILPADHYTEIPYSGDDDTVRGMYRAGDKGYIVEVAPKSSFSGTLAIMVGVDNTGAVVGVEITESGETEGFGANAKKPEWRAQFVGRTGEVKVDKDGGDIQGISGATLTSRGVAAGVTSALNAVAGLG